MDPIDLARGRIYKCKRTNKEVEFKYVGIHGEAIVCEPGMSGGGMQDSWLEKPSDLEEIVVPKGEIMVKPKETLTFHYSSPPLYDYCLENILELAEKIKKNHPDFQIKFSDLFVNPHYEELKLELEYKYPNPNYEAEMIAYDKWVREEEERQKKERGERKKRQDEADLAYKQKRRDRAAKFLDSLSSMSKEEQIQLLAKVLKE